MGGEREVNSKLVDFKEKFLAYLPLSAKQPNSISSMRVERQVHLMKEGNNPPRSLGHGFAKQLCMPPEAVMPIYRETKNKRTHVTIGQSAHKKNYQSSKKH
jgi:hypothetical protein